MEDKTASYQIGEGPLQPPSLTSEQDSLCARLDDIHVKYGLRVKPSDMFRGAIFAVRIECRSNPDWLAQAANSLREILYPFWSSHVDGVTDRKTEVFKKYGSVLIDNSFIQNVGRMYGLLNDLTHHGSTSTSVDFITFTIEDFEKLLADFERIMRDALTRQVDIHQEIDKILIGGPTSIVAEDTTS